jgi:hypothetical protein
VKFLAISLVVCCVAAASEFQNSATLDLRSEIALQLRASKFDPSRHKLTKNSSGAVRLTDGRQFFGTDGGLPRTQLDSASIIVEGGRVPLDVGQMYEPWFGTPSRDTFSLTRYGDGWVLTGLFSDGAETYVARWRILSGTSLREVISDNEDLISSLFRHSPVHQ